MKKFWKWRNQAQTETAPAERTLYLNGTIAEESWFDDDVTPQLFKEELMAGDGNITVWINSPGGDCVAAAQIYNMLMDYPHDVTVKIDGIAASAASVIAMAGTRVLMSPVSMLMIHNASSMCWGTAADMRKAADDVDKITTMSKAAYMERVSISEEELSALMDAETWISPAEALNWGFATSIEAQEETNPTQSARGSLMELVAIALQAKKEPTKDDEDDPDDPDDPSDPEASPEDDPEDPDQGDDPDPEDPDPDDGDGQDPEDDPEEDDEDEKKSEQACRSFFMAAFK